MLPPCTHLQHTPYRPPRVDACEECLRIGSNWVHLRTCLQCGQVGCCDSSQHRHATHHFYQSKHPVMASAEPGERWRWCYIDEQMGD